MKNKLDLILGMLFAVADYNIYRIISKPMICFLIGHLKGHHNILSWYIRPLFIIPMVIFAYKKSYTGIFASIFALFTSMFWFPVPAKSNPQVLEFLAFEMDYLKKANGPLPK